MIQHTVAFRLHHPLDSTAEFEFLRAAYALRKIPGVIDFTIFRQTSKKNEFTFGISMYFSSEQTYQAYNEHPEHVQFVNDIWLVQVAEFLELDYTEYPVDSLV